MPIAPSRRTLICAGGGLAAGAALAVEAPAALAGASSNSQRVVQTWFSLWVDQKEWEPLATLMTDDFAFSSTNGEDHISKAAFKPRCWEPNIRLITQFDLELMMAKGDQVFVKYLGHTTGGKSFRNVELHRVRDGKIASIECYFGGKATYPAAMERNG